MKRTFRAHGQRLRVQGTGLRDQALRSVLSNPRSRPFVSQNGFGALAVGRGGWFADVDDVSRFVLALGQAIRSEGIPVSAVAPICHAAGELVDNVREHAGSSVDSFAAFDVTPGCCWLTIADAGRGVLAGYVLGSAQGADAPSDSGEALDWAVLQHRSRTREPGRGLGYRRLLHALGAMDAAIRVRSDDASLEREGVSSSADWLIREQVSLAGFVVSVGLRW